jgi:RNA polymerase sigma-70 factor (ECF subfamily)
MGGTTTADAGEAPANDWFATLMGRVAPEALVFMTYWLGRGDVAEELVQEAVARAWQHRRRLQDAADPRAWFYTVVRNLAADHFRLRGRRPVVSPLEALRGNEPTVDPYPAVDTGLMVRDAMSRLSTIDQEILAWRYGVDLTIEEVAERMGMAPGTVKTRLHRALLRLRKGMVSDGR